MRSRKRVKAEHHSVSSEVNKLIRKIQSDDKMNLFLNDPVTQYPAIAQHYISVCPNRMWLNEMKRKNRESKYDSFQAWVNDFEQMIKNCLLFNANQPMYSSEARRIYENIISHIHDAHELFIEPREETPQKDMKAEDAIHYTATEPKEREETEISDAQAQEMGNGARFPVTLLSFMNEQDEKIRNTNEAMKFPCAQFQRKHSVVTLFSLYFAEVTNTDNLNNFSRGLLESLLGIFNECAPKVLLYKEEKCILPSDSNRDLHDNLGVDFFLRFAFHFRAIATVLGYSAEAIDRLSSVVQEMLDFVERFFSELLEIKTV